MPTTEKITTATTTPVIKDTSLPPTPTVTQSAPVVPAPIVQPANQPKNPNIGMTGRMDYSTDINGVRIPIDPATGEDIKTTSTTTTDATSKSQTALEKAQSDKAAKDAEIAGAAEKTSQEILNIQNGTTPLNAAQQAQISGLQLQFKQLIDSQNLMNTTASGIANVRGYQTGSAEYDPSFQVKTIGSIVSAGASKVIDLQVKEAAAVAELTQALKDDNIEAIKTAYDIANEARKNTQTALQKTVEDTQKAIEDAATAQQEAQKAYYDQVEKPINDVLSDAAKNGATPEQLEAIKGSQSVSEAIENAGDSLQAGSGIVGEYLYYKKQAEAAGQVPMDFNSYQNVDANRKAKAAAAANSSGFDKAQLSRVYALMDDYDRETKDTRTVLAASNQIDALAKQAKSNNKDSGTRASSQIGIIFSYMKMLDPTSTVREGEYATAQNTAGIPDKVRNAYNKAKDGSFLQDSQITGYVNTAKEIAKSRERTLENTKKEYDRRAAISGIPAGVITSDPVTSGDLVQSEEKSKSTVVDIVKTNPKAMSSVRPLIEKGYSYSDIVEALPEFFPN